MKSKKIHSNTKTIGNQYRGNKEPVVTAYLSSKTFEKLTPEDLKRLSNNYQLVHCSEYLQKSHSLSDEVFKKLYFLLFQLATENYEEQVVKKFLGQFDFRKMLRDKYGQKIDSADKIMLTKISKFLNVFQTIIVNVFADKSDCLNKEKSRNLKEALNSLIIDYHEYRLLDKFSNKSEFVVKACRIIEQSIIKYFSIFNARMNQTEWKNLSLKDFSEFYESFSELCQMRKRIRHISCRDIDLSMVEEISYETIQEIQDRHKKLNRQKYKQSEQLSLREQSVQTEKQQKNTDISEQNEMRNMRRRKQKTRVMKIIKQQMLEERNMNIFDDEKQQKQLYNCVKGDFYQNKTSQLRDKVENKSLVGNQKKKLRMRGINKAIKEIMDNDKEQQDKYNISTHMK